MTDTPDPLGPFRDPDDERRASRRRALWAMAVLAALAVIVGVVMVLLGAGSGTTGHHIDLLPPIRTPSDARPTPTPTAATPAPTASASVSGGSTGAGPGFGATPTGPPRTGNPCGGARTCVVPGDGGALAAANAFRAAHGRAPVPGGVTRDAQLCAQSKGGGKTCVPHYAWTAVADQSGAKAITKIVQFARAWLLDPSITTLSVGWAYVSGQYECVLLKAP